MYKMQIIKINQCSKSNGFLIPLAPSYNMPNVVICRHVTSFGRKYPGSSNIIFSLFCFFIQLVRAGLESRRGLAADGNGDVVVDEGGHLGHAVEAVDGGGDDAVAFSDVGGDGEGLSDVGEDVGFFYLVLGCYAYDWRDEMFTYWVRGRMSRGLCRDSQGSRHQFGSQRRWQYR